MTTKCRINSGSTIHFYCSLDTYKPSVFILPTMAVSDLVPHNTAKAKSTAVNSFKRFVTDQNVTLEHVLARFKDDDTGAIVEAVMDKFGMYLVTLKGRQGEPLAANSITSYFRHTKLWLLEMYPAIRATLDRKFSKMCNILSNHVMQRDNGGFVQRAPACTKADLAAMTTHLYSSASKASDYQDAALLCLMWYLLGRASDLAMLHKASLSRGPSAFFLRLLRVKTSDEQGLTIVPDKAAETCPITALALATAVQRAPSMLILDHFGAASGSSTRVAKEPPVAPLDLGLSLVDILDDPCRLVIDQDQSTTPAARTKTQGSTKKPPGIHQYVNRVLGRIGKAAQVAEELTSHSFRRGGAQHANGHSELSLQWIFDRGGWCMSSTNKGFAYVFNTTKEDQMVAKVMSGHAPRDDVKILDLASFDVQTQEEIRIFRDQVFGSSVRFDDKRLNMAADVLDVFVAYLTLHFPKLKAMNPTGPIVSVVEEAIDFLDIGHARFLAWGQHLALQEAASVQSATTKSPSTSVDASLIEKLIAVNNALLLRFDQLEARCAQLEARNSKRPALQDALPEEKAAPKKTKAPRMRLCDAWFAWYMSSPPMYVPGWTGDRRAKSDAKTVVAYMQTFAGANGFVLQPSDPSYRSRVLAIGQELEAKVMAFFKDHGVTASATGPAAKAFRTLRSQGALDAHVAHLTALCSAGKIVDPSPVSMRRDVLDKI